nr:MAG TPA: hypothetical protein [Caudoviricetes sp.]
MPAGAGCIREIRVIFQVSFLDLLTDCKWELALSKSR